MSTGFALLSAVGKVAGGISGFKQQQEQAKFLESQSQIAQKESFAEAERISSEQDIFAQRQRLSFLKSGFSLAGSPLAVLSETRRLGKEQVKSILDRGAAQVGLFRHEAKTARRQGRAALIGGFAGAASTAATAFSKKNNKD